MTVTLNPQHAAVSIATCDLILHGTASRCIGRHRGKQLPTEAERSAALAQVGYEPKHEVAA